MKLRPKQVDFAKCIHSLESYIWGLGFEISFGDAYRDPRGTFPYSHARSCHGFRLGRDYEISLDGILVTDFAALLPIGEYWESLDPRCRWGGRFKKPYDPGHFSFEHNGIK